MSSEEKTKKAVLFISAGLGDALLLLPLAKILNKQGYEVTALVTTGVPLSELIEGSGIFHEVVTCKGKPALFFYTLTHLLRFQLAIVNYFAASRTNLLAARKLATMVHCNRIPENAGERLGASLVYIKPRSGIQDAEQNMLLAGQGLIALSPELIHFRLETKPQPGLPEKFIALQVSAGNNIQTYKNWPVKSWIAFLRQCAAAYPRLSFVLLGDNSEVVLAEEILADGTANVISLAGKTTIMQAAGIINQSKLFMGPDSGLLHLAVCLNKPTLSLWGPSSRILYGYSSTDTHMNRSVSLNLSCSPCSAWIDANHSRVLRPEDCPDRQCLNGLSSAAIFAEFSTFAKSHALV